VKSSTRDIKSAELSPTRWIFGGLIFVTLYFQANLADPFNSPKSWILLITATWLAGYVVSFRKIIFSTKPIKNIFHIITFFTLTSLIITIFTDSPYIAFFGDTQRRNGFVSYLSLAVVLIASSIYIRLFNIKKLYITTYFVGSVTVIYALIQTTGNDFVKWNNPYNAIIGTLGNPNFAAAVMAIIGVITLSSVFISEFKLYFRVFALVLAFLLIFVIYKSNAKQGLLSYFLGGGVFLIILLWNKSKKLGILSIVSGISIFFLSVLGMLQVGPFQSFLYKPSVSVRGYYWRAGFEMFRDNPFLGVGMDRYGALSAPSRCGCRLTSNPARPWTGIVPGPR
jgi:O-antigen ligase